MSHLDVPQFLGLLVVVLATAKLLGAAAQRIGQPAVVLGELLAGVLVGASVLGLIDPSNQADPKFDVIHFLAEVGVVILLFEIGLETDLRKLLKVGPAAAAVAIVGIVLPFALGYFLCRWDGFSEKAAVMAGAALTATSVGITARVLSDLGRLQEPESQIVLGAAVLDDVMGLVILTIVAGLTEGEQLSAGVVLRTTAVAFGFLIATLLFGRLLVPPLFRIASRVIRLPGTPTMLAVMLAFGLAWLAHLVGSAMIIGAFAAGVLLAGIGPAAEIERGVAQLGHFFVPLFFVSVGAAVDARVFNPLNPANHATLLIGGLLIAAAVVGKFAAGYAPFWFRGKKSVIGVGMIPRGEVGLIFAQKGLDGNVFSPALFSAVCLMVMVTTFMAPPLLKLLFPPRQPDAKRPEPEGIEDLVTEA